jgi:hypothetical protein
MYALVHHMVGRGLDLEDTLFQNNYAPLTSGVGTGAVLVGGRR